MGLLQDLPQVSLSDLLQDLLLGPQVLSDLLPEYLQGLQQAFLYLMHQFPRKLLPLQTLLQYQLQQTQLSVPFPRLMHLPSIMQKVVFFSFYVLP